MDILEKHRLEVTDMLLTEYDEQLHINNEKGISFEEGKAEGKVETLDIITVVFEKLKAGISKEDIIASGVDGAIVETAEKLLKMNN